MSSDPAVNNTMEVDATIDGTTATTVATAERQIIDAIFETETSVPRLAHANSIAFEELLVFMRGAELVARFKAFFELLYRTTSPLGGQEELPPTPINWRIVLAAYLVAVRPTHVFQSTGETERILLHASSVLVRTFEAIYDTLATSHSRSLQDLPAQLVASFHDQLRAFLVAYDAWQIPDMEKLKMRLRNALIIIYRAYNAVESEDEETAQRAASMAALQEQMALLEAKLKKFCRDEEDGAAAVQALRDASVYETMKTQMVELGRFDECLSVFANLVRKIRQVDPTHQINDFVCITDMQKAAADGTLGTEAVIKALLDVVVVIKPLHKNGNERSFHEAWDVLHRELESDEFEETDGPAWISKALEFFSRQIRMLCVESGNKRLADLFPVLVEHGLKYEQDKFEKKFPAGSVLSNTKEWLSGVLARNDAARFDEAVSLQALEAGDKHLEFLAAAMLDYVSRDAAPLPEVLSLDAMLIEWMREELDNMERRAAMFSLVWHHMQARGFTEESSLILVSALEMIRTGVVSFADSSLEEDVHPALIGLTRTEFQSWPEKILNPESSTRQMTKGRILAYLFEHVTAITKSEISEDPVVDFMAIISNELKDFSHRFERMLSLNRSVHTATYARLLAELFVDARAEMDTSTDPLL